MPNLLIPCSGPGTRSIGYTKFHKALIRIGDCTVIDHIIDSFADIDKIYIISIIVYIYLFMKKYNNEQSSTVLNDHKLSYLSKGKSENYSNSFFYK